MKHEGKVYCGVDVAKKHLDALINGKTVRFENTVKGSRSLMARAGKVHFVFESTGGYERLPAWMIMAAGGAASIVNPARVRHYAIGIGQLAKTDAIDARVITAFADNTHPEPAEKPSKQQRSLTALVDRRQQLTEMRTAKTNRLETAGDSILRKMVQKHLRWIEREIKSIEKKIAKTIREDADMKKKAQCIERITGLGKVCSATLLAHLPEIGTISRQRATALAGLAPYNRDSGNPAQSRYEGVLHPLG